MKHFLARNEQMITPSDECLFDRKAKIHYETIKAKNENRQKKKKKIIFTFLFDIVISIIT